VKTDPKSTNIAGNIRRCDSGGYVYRKKREVAFTRSGPALICSYGSCMFSPYGRTCGVSTYCIIQSKPEVSSEGEANTRSLSGCIHD